MHPWDYKVLQLVIISLSAYIVQCNTYIFKLCWLV